MKKHFIYRFSILLLAFSLFCSFSPGILAVSETPADDTSDQVASLVGGETAAVAEANDTSLTIRSYLYVNGYSTTTTFTGYTQPATSSFQTVGTATQQISPAVIPPTTRDASWPVANEATYPFSCIVRLNPWFDENGDGVAQLDEYETPATGFLIAPNVVLTAAHVIYDRDVSSTNVLDKYALQVFWTCDAISGTYDSSNSPKVVSSFIDNRYTGTSGTTNYDWALLMLDRNLFSYTNGHFGIGTTTAESLRNAAIRLAGFDDNNNGSLRYADASISSATNYRITYNLATVNGNSGSPVYNKDNYTVWGIHTHEGASGVRFTSMMYQFFCERIDYSKNFYGYS